MRKLFIIICIIHTFLLQAQMLVDTNSVKNHLQNIMDVPGYRNYQDTAALNKVAAYIHSVFLKSSQNVSEQVFEVEGRKYRNIICSIDTMHAERIIIGAHYDVYGNQPGADDNASGIVGLLELADLLKDKKLKYRIDLVAFTLEEPVHFGSENMGSYRHASYLHENKIKVKGMIALEMLGYFSDKNNSQQYPLKILKTIYGSKGDFITVVRKFNNGRFPGRFKRKMKHFAVVKTKSFQGFMKMPGIGWSDHINYWKFGYSALMITDTAFFRNKNYHQKSDTIEQLDLYRMCKVIESVYYGIIHI